MACCPESFETNADELPSLFSPTWVACRSEHDDARRPYDGLTASSRAEVVVLTKDPGMGASTWVVVPLGTGATTELASLTDRLYSVADWVSESAHKPCDNFNMHDCSLLHHAVRERPRVAGDVRAVVRKVVKRVLWLPIVPLRFHRAAREVGMVDLQARVEGCGGPRGRRQQPGPGDQALGRRRLRLSGTSGFHRLPSFCVYPSQTSLFESSVLGIPSPLVPIRANTTSKEVPRYRDPQRRQ
ncbi:hypothetical protein LZ30DRAFT_683111 [Colletotrichum cereale]|nr:hypothetical protein LZ30DRAFT_683111 [Colletotrichum cereale]